MKKNNTNKIMCGVGIGMILGGTAAIAGSTMKACRCKKSNKLLDTCENVISEIGSMFKG